MKKHQNLFILVFAFTLLITGCISCSKQNAPSNRVGNQHVSGITVASLQKKFKTEMSPSIYNDLDWQHGLVTSLDLDHPNSMIRVKSKTDPNKALYYSDIDGVQRAYVVTTTDKTIDVRTIKDTPLSRFTLSSSNVVKTETFSNGGENYVPKQPDPDCEKCTLPPAEVTVALNNGSGPSYLALSAFYSYGGGQGGYWVQTPPGQYGGGGHYYSPFWTTYLDPSDNPFKLVLMEINPAYQQGVKITPNIVKYTTYNQWMLTDKKSIATSTVTIAFQIDKNGKLLVDKSEVIFYGYIGGTYKMNKTQYDAQYSNNGSSLSFTISGTYMIAALNLVKGVDVHVSLDNLKTTSPTSNVFYDWF